MGKPRQLAWSFGIYRAGGEGEAESFGVAQFTTQPTASMNDVDSANPILTTWTMAENHLLAPRLAERYVRTMPTQSPAEQAYGPFPRRDSAEDRAHPRRLSEPLLTSSSVDAVWYDAGFCTADRQDPQVPSIYEDLLTDLVEQVIEQTRKP